MTEYRLHEFKNRVQVLSILDALYEGKNKIEGLVLLFGDQTGCDFSMPSKLTGFIYSPTDFVQDKEKIPAETK